MSIKHVQMVFDAGELSGTEKAVLLAYCNFTDPRGNCWPGVERIADMTGFSVRTVKNVRKALIERDLLTTMVRTSRNRVRKTNMNRVNLRKLESLRMPEKDYDDDVIAELRFKDEIAADQQKCTTCTGSDLHECTTCPDQGQEVHRRNGAGDAPYPSVDPLGDPSSSSPPASVEPPAPAAEPAPKKTKKTPEQIIQERTDATPDEARAVADYVAQQGDSKGDRIRSLAWWLTNRDDRDLQRDLAHVRRYADAPTATVCGLHSVPMAGDCSSCMGDIRAGDTDAVRAHLAQVGADARPDLARALGAPQAAVGGRGDHIDWRAINNANKARNGYVGGTRGPTITSEEAAELAEMTNEQRRDAIMGWGPTAPAPATSRRQRESDGLFDRAMQRALQREAAEAGG